MAAARLCMLDLAFDISILARVAIVLAEGLAGGGLMRLVAAATLPVTAVGSVGGGIAATESASWCGSGSGIGSERKVCPTGGLRLR